MARRTKLLALRRDGWAYEDLVTAHPELGYRTAAHARKDAGRGLEGHLKEAASSLIAQEAMRLDRLQLALWSRAMNGDHQAVREIIRIMERRARMLGLDRQADLYADAAERDEAKGILGNFFIAANVAYSELTETTTETTTTIVDGPHQLISAGQHDTH